MNPIRLLLQNYSLIALLIKREWAIKYAGTRLKLIWVIIKPIFHLLFFTLIYTRILGIKSDNPPFILQLLVGLMTWQIFIETVNTAGRAWQLDVELIKKTTIPRLILPIYRVLLCLPDMLFYIVLFFITAFIIRFENISWLHLIFLPIAIVLHFIFTLSISLIVNALYITNRDFQLSFFQLIGYGVWLTPVYYTLDMLPRAWQPFAYLNPLTGLIEAYRFAFLGIPFSKYSFMSLLMGCILVVVAWLWATRLQYHIAERV